MAVRLPCSTMEGPDRYHVRTRTVALFVFALSEIPSVAKGTDVAWLGIANEISFAAGHIRLAA